MNRPHITRARSATIGSSGAMGSRGRSLLRQRSMGGSGG